MKVNQRYHLAINLQKIKKQKNLTTKQIANGAGLNPTTIFNWENFKTDPTLDNIKKLADYLNISVAELLSYKKGKFCW